MSRLRNDVDDLRWQIKNLQDKNDFLMKKIKKLERQINCHHKNLVFQEGNDGDYFSSLCYCKDCEKIIEEYENLKDFHKDRLEYYKNIVAEIESVLDTFKEDQKEERNILNEK
ncbi:MAG: hypothetical protein ACOCP4_00760 [Candidatus Woesearchaeota archaeon]